MKNTNDLKEGKKNKKKRKERLNRTILLLPHIIWSSKNFNEFDFIPQKLML